ncbi:MAG: endonuclease domain-containing protein [Rhizobiales bacterium]|nr:endonuclease domain-containing protein [Hyphomicrobiales bacterium]
MIRKGALPPPLWGRVGEGGKAPLQHEDPALVPAHLPISGTLRSRAKSLRRSMTLAEQRFWRAVRAGRFADLHFRRQVPIAGYIVDFVCHERRLVVEMDGATHGTDQEIARDALRTRRIEGHGYRVLRFWNGDVATRLPDVLDRLFIEVQAAGGAVEAGPA